jgi:DNA-binding CsgD family transcriptional regulator
MAARSGLPRGADEQGEDAGSDLLKVARKAAADLRWLDAYEALSEFDRGSGLAVEDLEVLATAAFLCGLRHECRQARLRAYQLYLHRGDARKAARCASWIGLEALDPGEIAEATGCLPVSLSTCSAWAAQASALLDQEPEGAEHGYALVPVAYERLAMADDPRGAAEGAARAAALGRTFGDADLLAMAGAIQGRALVRSARLAEGMALMDESVALAVAGEVTPTVAGIALTAAVDTGGEAFDLARCDDWTRSLARWCERQEGMMAFRSRSLVAQAASERRHGRWEAALDIAEQACEPRIAELDPAAAAAAHYEQGEVLRLHGEHVESAAAYRRAGALARDPQPGMALLRLAEGDTAGALQALQRALGEARSDGQRARLLPAQVETLLAAGDRSAAADAARALEHLARTYTTPAVEATARQASAAVRLAEDDASAALACARQAHRVWRHFGMPYEEAQARLLIAICCRKLGDDATAALEHEAACETLAMLGARPALDHARNQFGPPAATSHGLTRREGEVLALLATGLTNRAIAGRLHVTTRTVDTHVGRILTKLGVPTRAAATAFAHRHGLV